MHEISHNLAFGYSRPMHNRILGSICYLPIGLRMSISFEKHHREHHRYQGDEVIDTDIPTLMESRLFESTFGKFMWVCLKPFFYTFRPLIINLKQPTRLEIVHTIIHLSDDAVVVYCFGWQALAYLLIGSILAMGLHPDYDY
ncbi:hypothetical protein ACLKA7_004970 [Drosophila subpalustris]